jgi:hypothetical protein
MFLIVTHVPPAVVTNAGLNTGFAGGPAGMVEQAAKHRISIGHLFIIIV